MRLGAAVVVLIAWVQLAAAEPTRDYVVRPGDTCMAIAVRELGGRDQLDAIHRLNPNLGPTPHHLIPGQILKLPVVGAAKPDARLAGQEGTVELRRAGEESWFPAITGADLFRAWRVGSREDSSAQIAFADSSTIAMRENTVVIIYGATRAQAATSAGAPFTATLERGTLRSRLADLDGTATVATAGGDVKLGGGSALVDVDEARTTRVSNHVGKPAAITSKTARPKAVAVTAGFGSKAEVNKDPTPPRPLPPTPAWQDVPALALAPNGTGAIVTGSWAPVVEAASYRVELARDADMKSVALRAQVPGGAGGAGAFEIRGVPPGDYWVAVASVDGDRFESKPSDARAVHVIALSLPTEAAAIVPGQPPALALGAVVDAPAGLTCALDASPGAAQPGAAQPGAAHVIVDRTGPLALTCRAPDGGAATFAINVDPVTVAASTTPPIHAGYRAALDVAIRARRAPAGTVIATSQSPGVVVERVDPTATGVRVYIRASTTAATGPAAIVVALKAADDREIALGSVSVQLVAAAPPLGIGTNDERVSIELTGGAELASHAQNGLVGAAVHIAASRYVAAELGLRVGDPVGVQVGIAFQLPGERLTPSLRAGIALRDQDTTHPGGYAGLDLAIGLIPALSAVIGADGVYVDRPELQIMAGLRVGL